MGERKVLNKYYPPDFDPAKIPRRRQPKNQQMKVRMMLPMSIRCGTCGNYIYKGTKFNSRKEDVVGEEMEEEKKKRVAEEMGDAMKSLENRTLDSKREMDILAALDEMKSMKSRHATVSVDAMLEALQRSTDKKEKKLDEEDEALIKSVFKEKKLDEEDEALIKSVFKGAREAGVLRRIDDEDLDDDEDLGFFLPKNEETSSSGPSKVNENCDTCHLGIAWIDALTNGSATDSPANSDKFIFKSPSVRVAIVKKSSRDSNGNKPRKEETEKQDAEFVAVKEETGKVEATGLQSLLQQYGSDED
ncbi:hypothetical protein CDL12_29692 [Handroanthus impetiginosus]|uniref:Splicing factor YJU2 n=1 Tax=Handroanthus impetiginosus TaxID=429701 RepID=A0A2G9FY72_9LAMI|nr:hypothetical protein CDL12_29692 [Handroanthus impetiginosus]